MQEPMADEVITSEPELSFFVFFFKVLFASNKYSVFLSSVVICINETVGLWRTDFEQSLW